MSNNLKRQSKDWRTEAEGKGSRLMQGFFFVFFGGTILIWPLLDDVKLDSWILKVNERSLGTWVIMCSFENYSCKYVWYQILNEFTIMRILRIHIPPSSSKDSWDSCESNLADSFLMLSSLSPQSGAVLSEHRDSSLSSMVRQLGLWKYNTPSYSHPHARLTVSPSLIIFALSNGTANITPRNGLSKKC